MWRDNEDDTLFLLADYLEPLSAERGGGGGNNMFFFTKMYW